MSTSETKPPKQSSGELSSDVRSDASPAVASERARAIARRSFLRRSAGIAAPVVMTLQSGPVMAIASITCQDKTSITIDPDAPDNPNVAKNPSGFVKADPAQLDVSDIRNLRANASLADNTDNGFNVLVIDPANTTTGLGKYALSSNGGPDGIVRCVPTDLGTAGSSGQNGDFQIVSNKWIFRGSDFAGGSGLGDPINPYPNTGPVALFTIDGDNEDVFIGCYGDHADTVAGTTPPQDVAGATPMTHSCYSSLHPEAPE